MAILSGKARLFISGRRGQMEKIRSACKGQKNIIWVHSASYGEFEEVRPVIDCIKAAAPGKYRFLVTFFSPSGYEHLKNDPAPDWVFYMPLDTPRNARRFLDAVRPVKMIFCITDFWLFHIAGLRKRGIDTYVVSARFREGMSYFGPLGRPYIRAFKGFRQIFTSNEESLMVLRSHGVENCSLMGDSRMDRVLALAAQQWSDPVIDAWTGGRKVFVGGSTLPDEDSSIMAALANAHPEDKFLIVPHEVGEKDVAALRSLFKGKTALYTEPDPDAQVLIVNIVGILSRIYRYGFAAYVGAGFDGAPHSIIEPAAYGIPVSFGPQFGPVWHCEKMIEAGCGFALGGVRDALDWYERLKKEPEFTASCGKAARDYCVSGSGAASKIALSIIGNQDGK